jgi:hypothetical protein
MDWDKLAQVAAFNLAFVQHGFPFGFVGTVNLALLQAVTATSLSNASW